MFWWCFRFICLSHMEPYYHKIQISSLLMIKLCKLMEIKVLEIIFALKCIQDCFLRTFQNINQELNFLGTKIRWHIGHLRLFCCWSKITSEFLSAVRPKLVYFASSPLIFVEYKVSLLSHITLNLNFYEPYVLNKLFVISSLKYFCVYEFLFHMLLFRCTSVEIEEKREGKKLNFQFLLDNPH